MPWPIWPICSTGKWRCWSIAATATACRRTCPASKGPRAAINHGLKALQISVSAWTAEALKLTMPASVFSRSTECHNQDKVSMGTIAARDCLRILELTEQVAAGIADYGAPGRLAAPQD